MDSTPPHPGVPFREGSESLWPKAAVSREGFYSLIVAQAACGLLAGGCGRRKGVAGETPTVPGGVRPKRLGFSA